MTMDLSPHQLACAALTDALLKVRKRKDGALSKAQSDQAKMDAAFATASLKRSGWVIARGTSSASARSQITYLGLALADGAAGKDGKPKPPYLLQGEAEAAFEELREAGFTLFSMEQVRKSA